MNRIAKLLIVVLTWKATYFQPRPCETFVPDPYTGQALCGTYQTLQLSRHFDKREDADKFIEKCPKGTCSDVRVYEQTKS